MCISSDMSRDCSTVNVSGCDSQRELPAIQAHDQWVNWAGGIIIIGRITTLCSCTFPLRD